MIDDKLNQQKRAARGMCGVCKNREKKDICICVVIKYSMQGARLWRGKWALFKIHLLARGNARAFY